MEERKKTMTFREQLIRLWACEEALEWVGNKSLEEAWKTCKNPEWMIWILTQTDLDLIDPVCDIAEEVLHLVPEDRQLACIWSISAARRRAKRDELKAAYDAATDYANEAYFGSRISYFNCAVRVAYTAYHIATDYKYNKEKTKQCNIIRKYFTITQVKKALKKLVT